MRTLYLRNCIRVAQRRQWIEDTNREFSDFGYCWLPTHALAPKRAPRRFLPRRLSGNCSWFENINCKNMDFGAV